ncbi:hypothetical protein M3Y94_00121400 [Aphelenchoides besseyi]|nr:hypothetical protein M3Y94_00121400 [Aphelenchoides besseyi]
MKRLGRFDFFFCAQHEVERLPIEHSPRCLYGNELKPSKMSICSVVSSTSVCSSDDGSSQFSHKTNSRSTKKSTAGVSSYKLSRKYCCRRSESALLNEQHPHKIPLIIERFKNEKRLRELDRCQFMLPPRATVGQLQHVIRKRVCDGRNMAIYILIDGELPALDSTVAELAERYRSDDGWLYIRYSSEDTLG